VTRRAKIVCIRRPRLRIRSLTNEGCLVLEKTPTSVQSRSEALSFRLETPQDFGASAGGKGKHKPAKGEYVKLTEEELDSVEAEANRNIELKQFVPVDCRPHILRQ
jgi:hypothetical protein